MIKIVGGQKSTSLKYKYICLINLAHYCESINSDCSKCQRKTEKLLKGGFLKNRYLLINYKENKNG